jgi:hypothetical protein
MTHKTLIRKAQSAKNRSDIRVRRLHAVSSQERLSEADKAALPKLRKLASRAIRCSIRMERRVAKVMGTGEVPQLLGSSFKKSGIFKKLKAQQGKTAATGYLLSLVTGDTLANRLSARFAAGN